MSDTLGGALPGVAIEASSPNLQGTRRTTTAPDGTYRIPALPPGLYRVTASAPELGAGEAQTSVPLGATSVVNLTLTPLRAESVVVTAESTPIDTTSTEGGTHYTAEVLARLPVSRNFADVVFSNPGVLQDRGQTQGRIVPVAIYGATSTENQWAVDGINTTNVQKGFQGKILIVESVEEVAVTTGGYQAEYGRAIGGLINVVTKSGGNRFHGGEFVYYDSSDTTAKPVATDRDLWPRFGMRVSDYTRTDFGADLGGFILRDRLWFFASYDRVELPAKVSRNQPAPLVPTSMQFPLDGVENLYTGKVTWNASPGTTAVATVFGDPAINTGAGWADPRQGTVAAREITDPDPGRWQTTRSFGGTDAGLRLSQFFGSSSLLNLQASRHEDSSELKAAGPALSEPRILDFRCEGGTFDSPCFPPHAIFSGGLGPVGGADDRNRSTRYQYGANLTLFRGNHEAKLGGDYLSATTTSVEANSGGQSISILNQHGVLYYRHFLFVRNATDLTPVEIVLSPKTRDYGAYVQDTWRVSSGWTINAGLRWDGEDVRDYRDMTVIRTNTWQPRLGVVWDPLKDGQTKVYAFAGRFSWALPTNLSARAFGAYTTASVYNFDPISLVPDPTVPFLSQNPEIGGGSTETPIDRGLRGAYQDELTAGVERVLSPGFSVALKGTYRRLGRAIEDRCDLDYGRVGNTCGIMNPGSNGKIALGDIPGCNGLDDGYYECTDTIPATPPARRLYRGIEILARYSAGAKLWLQGSYVFSSLRGNLDGGQSSRSNPGETFDFDYPANIHNGYGRLYLDRPHSLRFDGTYALPFNVSLGLSAYYQSGAPLNRNGYVGFIDPRGYTGRMPSIWEADLLLFYPITVGAATIMPQVYIFNVFNNQTPTFLNTDWAAVPPEGYPATLFDPNQPQSNPYYGYVISRQDPRKLRVALKIAF